MKKLHLLDDRFEEQKISKEEIVKPKNDASRMAWMINGKDFTYASLHHLSILPVL